MVAIDMRMPVRCYDCPLVYMISTGPDAGTWMCKALEYKGEKNNHRNIQKVSRPDDCPMYEVGTVYHPP